MTAPVRVAESVALVYARINALLANALATLAVPVRVTAPAGRALRPRLDPAPLISARDLHRLTAS